MADRELVIKIPEELYNYMQTDEYDEHLDKRFDYQIRFAVKGGTPLPKGHGKLKDFDKIEWYGCDFEGRACIEAKGNCSVCEHANCNAKQVRELPTIIEADNEVEDDD